MSKKPGPDALAIRILSPDGKEGYYIPFSERLPEFLAKYKPEEGWGIERSVQEALSLVPGLQSLYLAAIAAGQKPSDLGLPPLPTGLVYTAKLVDKEGRVVAMATAYGKGLDMLGTSLKCKDHESAETAAYQRLISSLGFDGSVLDKDEMVSISLSGRRVLELGHEPTATTAATGPASGNADVEALLDGVVPVDQSGAAQEQSATSEATAPTATVAKTDVPEAAAQTTAGEVVVDHKTATAAKVEDTANAAPANTEPKRSGPSSKQILAAKRRMIATLAKTLKEEAIEVQDEAAADAEIARLSAIGQARKVT